MEISAPYFSNLYAPLGPLPNFAKLASDPVQWRTETELRNCSVQLLRRYSLSPPRRGSARCRRLNLLSFSLSLFRAFITCRNTVAAAHRIGLNFQKSTVQKHVPLCGIVSKISGVSFVSLLKHYAHD